MKINFILNNEDICVEMDPGSSTLRFLREDKGLTSVKTGCGEGECGACTIVLGTRENGKMKYKNVASCLLPLGELNGKHVVTLEGINQPELSPVQKAFVDEGAIQCGFCTPGFIMSITGFFLSEKEMTGENILNSIDGNICRCTGYYSIKRATEKVLIEVASRVDNNDRVNSLSDISVIPGYFKTIADRLAALELKGEESVISGKDTLLIAGGTDLLVGGVEAGDSDIRFISGVEGISDISEENNFINVGAGASVENIIDSEILKKHFPGINEFMYLISSQIIRNTATLGGNIVNASPIGDLSVLFLPLDPVLEIRSGKGVREVYLRKFFKGYKVMDLLPGELIYLMKIPVPKGNIFFNFEKVSRRKYLDIASCNSSAYFQIEDEVITKCNISAGGVAPIPLYLEDSSRFLSGKEMSSRIVEKVVEIASGEISPISDVRGSSEYKKELLKQLIRAHFEKLEGWTK
ncbi:MAG: FAD binding domain-containing protein [Acidobacteriota bacterium]